MDEYEKYLEMLKTILIAIVSFIGINAQQIEQHVWKVINKDNGSKFWYDGSAVDTIMDYRLISGYLKHISL